MKTLLFTLFCILMATTSIFAKSVISKEVIAQTIAVIQQKNASSQAFRIQRGVEKTAQLWQEQSDDQQGDEIRYYCYPDRFEQNLSNNMVTVGTVNLSN